MANATQPLPLPQWFLFEGKTGRGIDWSAVTAALFMVAEDAHSKDASSTFFIKPENSLS